MGVAGGNVTSLPPSPGIAATPRRFGYSVRKARTAGASTRVSGRTATAAFVHQYIGVGRSLTLRIRVDASSTGAASGSHRSTWNTTLRIRSHSHRRSIGSPRGPSTLAAWSVSIVVGECPRVPMFHSTPPENQALRRARLAGCRTGFV
jgi:hypothetical protein